jgi:hypothetical protein
MKMVYMAVRTFGVTPVLIWLILAVGICYVCSLDYSSVRLKGPYSVEFEVRKEPLQSKGISKGPGT